MNRWTAVTLSLVFLLSGGIVHGLYADRWQSSTALEEACAKVALVPHEADGWIGEDQDTVAEEFAQAGAQGHWTRKYRKDGKEFLVILMAGRAGRMSVHTPEVCYRGAGYDLAGTPMVYAARGADNDELGVFWSAKFVRPGSVNTELQLAWSWSDGQLWAAPKSPRWTFAGQPALYKLYVSQNVTGLSGDAATKNRDEFLKAFLPELNRTLGIESLLPSAGKKV